MVPAPALPAHVQVAAAPQHHARARLLESWEVLLLWPSLLYPTEGVSVSKGMGAVAAVGIGWQLKLLLAV